MDSNCTSFISKYCFAKNTLKEVDENYQSISSWFESPADVYEIKKILQQFQEDYKHNLQQSAGFWQIK